MARVKPGANSSPKFVFFQPFFAISAGDSSCNQASTGLGSPAVKEPVSQPYNVIEGQCAGRRVCPLSRVQAGQMVCIKGLVASPETCVRLRELGFCEEQKVRLLAREATFICQVCNARLGISEKLAETILVETLSRTPHG